jgi:hypothetical protein
MVNIHNPAEFPECSFHKGAGIPASHYIYLVAPFIFPHKKNLSQFAIFYFVKIRAGQEFLEPGKFMRIKYSQVKSSRQDGRMRPSVTMIDNFHKRLLNALQ